jgi:hypothetical protein
MSESSSSMSGATVTADEVTLTKSGASVLSVKPLGITASELATDAVETAKIKNLNVTPPKTTQIGKLVYSEVITVAKQIWTINPPFDLDTAKAYRIVLHLTNNNVASVNYAMYFNNDTANHYTTQFINGAGTAHVAWAGSVTNLQYYNNTTNAVLYVVGSLQRLAPAVSSSPAFAFHTSECNGTSASTGSIIWSATDNVTRIDIYASLANGIGVGSQIEVYQLG